MQAHTPSILRLPQVEALTGLTRSPIYRRIADGDFPAPVLLGKRAVGWRESEIAEWIESRPRATEKRHAA